jgi:type IV secretory pathway VirB2 component (pilin)
MAFERLKNSALSQAAAELMTDLSDLVQKELRLARAELSEKMATKLRGGLWLAIAGLLAFIAILLAAQAVAYGMASYGLALHWSFLAVALVFGGAAIIAFLTGRASAEEDLTPTRTFHQFSQDISTVKERLT